MPFNRDIQHAALCATVLFTVADAHANPQGMTVAAGSATALASGQTLNIAVSQNAALNWQTFNIAANETVNFQQPSATSVVWNRILDQNPSQIWGRLNASGTVVLMNQSGFYFGPNSSINVGGFLATTAWVAPPSSGGGAMWTYQGPPPSASIINYGEVKAATGGSIFLVAEKIENHGVLTAPDGTLGLYAGKQVLISERPDGRGLSANVALPDGSVDNLGKLIADAGTIALRAQVVNQGGLIQADSVRERNGVIELVAGDAINLGANSIIQANGDDSGASTGGSVAIKSAGKFSDDPASRIQVRGGANGGNAGAVEVSALKMRALNSQIDATAQPGSSAGSLLLDPYDIELSAGIGDTSSPATVNANDPSTDPNDPPLQLDVTRAFKGKHFSRVTLQALHDITLDDNLNWNLNSSIGSAAGSTLTLMAGHNINFGFVDTDGKIITPGNGAKIVSGQTAVGGTFKAGTDWTVSLLAGVDFSLATPAVKNGVGGIYNAKIQSLAGGGITLNAGHEVLIGGGYLRTLNGGDISVTAGDGNVDAGSPASLGQHNNTYSVNDNTIDTARGGIATEKGGGVAINAGGNITTGQTTIAALGAGDVSLTAGGNISGNFYERNGNGSATVTAQGNVGDGANGATFGLTAGSWSINAPHGSIFINEFYNFNGAFGSAHLFDYAATASATLTAKNSVQLLGNAAVSAIVGSIAPPKLAISAGAGGVTLGEDLTLFPSSQGGLNVTTTGGGSLASAAGQVYQLKVSDADGTDYSALADGHAATPVHLGETASAVTLSIDGGVNNLFLRSPGAADIHIHGDAYDFGFEGQNLAGGETTKIAIDGNYSVRDSATYTTLANANLDIFQNGLFSTDTVLGGKLFYNAATKQFGFYGKMSADDLAKMLNPTVYVVDPPTGLLKYDADGNPLTQSAVFTTDTAALLALQQATQDASQPAQALAGIIIHGPGRLQISAHNLDLGASGGIQSFGAYQFADGTAFQSLGKVMVQGNSLLPGASIDLKLSGSLNMTASQIVSTGGGGISIRSAGSVNVGQQNVPFIHDDTPRGIYTGHGGSVTVQAVGDINVNGSRIASYDGGDVTVASDTGSVNAGDGAKGFFKLAGFGEVEFTRDASGNIDPASVTVNYDKATDRFFGSGIIALTSSTSDAHVGNIAVTAHGDIEAGTGGILQLAFNSVDQSAATLVLHSTDGSIHAGNSGVLGRNISAIADRGSVDGLFVAAGNADIHASQNVNVTALAGGNANVSGGGTVSGSVVGGGNVSVAGAEVSAAAISTGGTATGGSGSGSAFAGVAAPTAQKTTDDADKTVAANQSVATSADEDEKKKRNAPALAQKVSRVTVILPKKS